MVSTTQKFWVARNGWSEDGPPVFEVECFVAADGKVMAVPGAGFTGYAMEVGREVFTTKQGALNVGLRRARKDMEDFKRYLANAETRIATLLKEGAT